jgi:hypothetical protein
MASSARSYDFADVGSDEEIRDSIDGAAPTAGEPPRPLRREPRAPDPYPVDALGSLASVVRAVQQIVEAPVEICAQSALAHAALAIQGHADVVLPTGQLRPVSLFLMSVARSGDRKSAADDVLAFALMRREKALCEDLVISKANYRNDLEAWNAARSQAKATSKDTARSSMVAALDDIGSEPVAPREAIIAFPEPTLEGLHKYLAVGQPSMGLFSDEGGMFVGGVGMAKEHALKTAAGFSKLWDGSAIKRLRAGDGNTTLFGRRVSLHLMLQPDAANHWLADPVLRDQGLFSRILIVAPQSLAGKRFGREAERHSHDDVTGFGLRLLAIYERPMGMADDTNGGLEPRRLPLSAEASAMWWDFAHSVECELGDDGRLNSVYGLAGKVPEHAARLASVLALFDDLNAAELSAIDLARGIKLANWYLGEALRLAEVGAVSDDVRLAEKLLAWLRSGWPVLSPANPVLVSLVDIYQSGPGSIREKAVAERAVTVLRDHGWLVKVEGGGTVRGVRRREVFTIRS